MHCSQMVIFIDFLVFDKYLVDRKRRNIFILGDNYEFESGKTFSFKFVDILKYNDQTIHNFQKENLVLNQQKSFELFPLDKHKWTLIWILIYHQF